MVSFSKILFENNIVYFELDQYPKVYTASNSMVQYRLVEEQVIKTFNHLERYVYFSTNP